MPCVIRSSGGPCGERLQLHDVQKDSAFDTGGPHGQQVGFCDGDLQRLDGGFRRNEGLLGIERRELGLEEDEGRPHPGIGRQAPTQVQVRPQQGPGFVGAVHGAVRERLDHKSLLEARVQSKGGSCCGCGLLGASTLKVGLGEFELASGLFLGPRHGGARLDDANQQGGAQRQ